MSKENDPKELIKKIRNSNNHDDVAADLYEALCPGKTPPYRKWVATWILKCINEYTKMNAETKEFLYASFALLEKYTLNGTTIEGRLAQYLEDSDYTTRHDSTKQNRTYQQIADAPDGETEIAKMLENLRRYEREATNKLSEYIIAEISLKEIPKHIAELDKYGTKLKDGSGYKHNPQQFIHYETKKDTSKQNPPEPDSPDDEPISIEVKLCAFVSVLLNTQIKRRIIARIRRVIVVIISILIVTGLCMTVSRNKNLEQIELDQIQDIGVTYPEIQHEDVSSEDVPLDKPIFKEVSIYDDKEKEVKRIKILAGESSVLSAHFSPDDADTNNLDISSEDTSKLNIKIIDTGIPGKLPFLAKAEASEDTGCFPTSILVEGSGAIPACVNVYIEPNSHVHYDNEDIQNSRVSKNGGVDNAK